MRPQSRLALGVIGTVAAAALVGAAATNGGLPAPRAETEPSRDAGLPITSPAASAVGAIRTATPSPRRPGQEALGVGTTVTITVLDKHGRPVGR